MDMIGTLSPEEMERIRQALSVSKDRTLLLKVNDIIKKAYGYPIELCAPDEEEREESDEIL